MNLSFGIQIEPQFGFNKQEIDSIAKKITSSSSWDMIWLSDHFFLDKDAKDKSSFECWTLMTYLVTKYKNLRVGSLTLCNNYRNPSLLAKMIATLDQLSEGRIEIGYGAGWKDVEYKAYGYEFPSVKERIDQFEDGIQVLRKLWTEEKVNFQGKYYQLQEAICEPKPYQERGPNIWVGTPSGGRRMVGITAKFGDGINLVWNVSVERCREIIKSLKVQCDEIKRNLKEIKLSIGFLTRIFNSKFQLEEFIEEQSKKRKVSTDKIKEEIKGMLYGTKEEIIEKIKQYKELGFSHFIFLFPEKEELVYLDKFENEIILKL